MDDKFQKDHTLANLDFRLLASRALRQHYFCCSKPLWLWSFVSAAATLVIQGPGSVGFGSWKGVTSRILHQGVHGCCSQRLFQSRVCVLGSWRSCCHSRCWGWSQDECGLAQRFVTDRPPLPQPSEAEVGVPGAGLGSVLCGSIDGDGVVEPWPATLRV